MIRRARALVSRALYKVRFSRGVIEGNRRMYEFQVRGKRLRIADGQYSYGALIVARELSQDCYGLDEIRFGPRDVAIDIGAHVGLVSCYLAKRHPFLKIYAFEPFQENYDNLLLNLKNNDIQNVVPSHQAVTGDGRVFKMKIAPGNTGGGTGQLRSLEDVGHTTFEVASITLDRIFEENGIVRCRLLKIDCEGSEHEILSTCTVLGRVDYLRGEFHINEYLREKGYSTEKLLARCKSQISPENVKVQVINMAE